MYIDFSNYFLFVRILQLYAEENAIDDTIYYLGEALSKGVIELEVFLKVCGFGYILDSVLTSSMDTITYYCVIVICNSHTGHLCKLEH